MAQRAPRAAVIMPAWNAEKTIERTVRSILAQTMGDLVLIAVDDGSTDATGAILKRLQAEGYTVVAVEQTVHSVKLDRFRREPGRKYALIFGNEVSGVQQEVVDAADFSLEIPQQGTKHSLNVSVSVGVVLWGLHA